MKKIFSAITAAALVLGASAYAADFSDLPETHWAYSAVSALVKDGTVNGDESGHFNPDAQVTRAEMVKMVGKGTATAAYADVDASHWGYDYITTSGVAPDADGNFRPSEPMTRGDVVELLWQRAGSPTGASAPDSVKSQHKNPEAAAWGYESGVMRGYEDGSMMYESGISRAEAAAVIVRSRGNGGEYAAVKAQKPDAFTNTYKNLGMAQNNFSYGAINANVLTFANMDNASSLIPDGRTEGETAAMADAAKMYVKGLKKLNPAVPAATDENSYLSVPLSGNADAERIGAVIYMADQKAPLGIKYASDGTTERVHINSSSVTNDENKFIYRLAEVPDEVYNAPLGKVSKEPWSNYNFANEFAGLFTSVTSRCEKIAKEQAGIDVKITFYPSLSWNTGSSYKYRVKCDIVSVNGKTVSYKDVFGGESAQQLADGMTFWADIESDYAFGMGVGALFDFSDPVFAENK